MKKSVKFFVSMILVTSVLMSFAGCSKKEKNKDNDKVKESDEVAETTDETEETSIPTVASTAPTTVLPDFSGPLPSSDIAISWNETSIDQKVMYAVVSPGGFLRVRGGPGTDYDIVGSLTTGMEVVVVAITDNGWYKTSDGFFISGDFLSTTPVA